MKTFTRSILVALLLIIAAPAYSAPGTQAIQIFVCEYSEDNENANADTLFAMASTWLKAAKTMPGGKGMKAFIRFPITEGAQGEGDFRFVISTPTFAEWGAFTDAYEGSAASKVDDEFDNLADCGNSTMWEGQFIE
jgi:hypothetical protein